jgi:2-oxoglutarate/2-oxoacid ferredoxin oxidoreductase subunit alpha
MSQHEGGKAACDISIRIGGEAGQGMNSVSGLLGKAFVREGFYVFIHHDVMSRIRGGHNFTQLRISGRPVQTLSSRVDILVCLDANTLDLYKDSLDGLIIYDEGKIKGPPPSGRKYLPLPMEKVAEEIGGTARMANSVASGALMALTGLPLEPLTELLDEVFSHKDKKTIQANKECALKGYQRVREKGRGSPACGLPSAEERGKRRMLITGSEAMALGALAANLRFYSAYPMSPATAIMEYLASKKNELGLVVEQAEDEIAAINMAIGASFCGARSMTGTSGGGLALMVEGISLAGMTETPVVIVDGQRPAPATGLPTRTEQADLLFVAHCAHGEFPRAILAPATAAEAFDLTGRAFYLAEKYQVPVFVLGDQHLNDSSWTVEPFDLKGTQTESPSLMPGKDLEGMSPYAYKRYQITGSGISPRILPGTSDQVLYADSDEHTEEGHITESAEIRRKMVNKRMRKAEGLKEEMSPPRIYPDKKAERYAVSWGSTFGAVEEAVLRLRDKGMNIGYVHFSEIFPLKEKAFPPELKDGPELIGVENNATGQFARLLKMEAGVSVDRRILKFDGRPFSPQELILRIEDGGGHPNDQD